MPTVPERLYFIYNLGLESRKGILPKLILQWNEKLAATFLSKSCMGESFKWERDVNNRYDKNLILVKSGTQTVA